MATAETAKLLASLDLDPRKFVAGSKTAMGSLDKLSAKTVAIGTAVGVGIERLAEAGIRKLSGAISGGLDSLAQLEDATTSVDGAIAQVGKGWTITSAQIADKANEIEAATQAAFDDKAITQSATTLIRYGKISQENLFPAMEVMTDLAARTGSVESASEALAKALADPTKATRLLRTAGVTLTKDQQKQIAQWVKSGQLAKAQAFLLGEVGKQTKGAAAAMHGPFRDSQLVLADVVEDAQRALGTGLLPVIMEVRKELSTELAKKSTLDNIKKVGQGLADGFREAVKWIKSVPWDQVASVAGHLLDFGKGIASAFMGLPTEAKGLILGLAALNKLSGGAVIKVGVDLLSGAAGGLFQQFLGRGSVANPMVVVPVGGSLTPGTGVTPTGGSKFSGILKAAIVGAVVVEGFKAWTDSLQPFITQNNDLASQGLTPGEIEAQKYYTADEATQQAIFKHLGRIPTREEWLSGNAKKTQPLSPDETPAFKQPTAELAKAMQTLAAMQKAAKDEAAAKADAQKAATAKAMATLAATQKTTGDEAARKAEAQKTALERVRSNAITNRMETVSAQRAGDSSIVSAIERNRPIITVNVDRSGNVTTAYDTGTTINGVHPGLR